MLAHAIRSTNPTAHSSQNSSCRGLAGVEPVVEILHDDADVLVGRRVAVGEAARGHGHFTRRAPIAGGAGRQPAEHRQRPAIASLHRRRTDQRQPEVARARERHALPA